jgi:hypothetical protein
MPEIVQKWQKDFKPDSKAGYQSSFFSFPADFMTFLRD